MIKKYKLLSLLTVSTPFFFTSTLHAAELTSVQQQASYAIGVNFARTIQQQGVPVDSSALAAGIQDVLKGSKLALTLEQMQSASTQYVTELKQQQAAVLAEQAEANKKQGAAFLAKNKEQEG